MRVQSVCLGLHCNCVTSNTCGVASTTRIDHIPCCRAFKHLYTLGIREFLHIFPSSESAHGGLGMYFAFCTLCSECSKHNKTQQATHRKLFFCHIGIWNRSSARCFVSFSCPVRLQSQKSHFLAGVNGSYLKCGMTPVGTYCRTALPDAFLQLDGQLKDLFLIKQQPVILQTVGVVCSFCDCQVRMIAEKKR